MAFPTIPTTGASRLLTGFDTTPATATFPDLGSLTKNPGDLLIAIIAVYQSTAAAGAVFSGWGGGFTEFVDQRGGTTQMSIGAAYKWSTGSETGTFTVTTGATVTGHGALILMSIPGAHATTPPEGGTIAVGTTAAANPGALNPAGWDAEDTLWIAVGASGETSTTGSYTGMGLAAGPPTNYGSAVSTGESGDVIGAVACAVAFRELNAASEDVGQWSSADLSNARNVALVIAVRPAPVATPIEVDIVHAGGPTNAFSTVDEAQALVVTKPIVMSITPAVETGEAQALDFQVGYAIQKTITPATETDFAAGFSVAKSVTIKPPVANLIANEGGEVDDSNWTDNVFGLGAVASRTTAEHRFGEACIAVTCPGNAAFEAVKAVVPSYTFKAGVLYTVECWVKAPTGLDWRGGAHGDGQFDMNGGGGFIAATGDDEWHFYSRTFTPSTDRTDGGFLIQTNENPGSEVTFFVDGVAIYEGDGRAYTHDEAQPLSVTKAVTIAPATEADDAATPYAARALSLVPDLYWRLNETTGTAVADSSGNGNTGTIARPQQTTLAQPGLIEDPDTSMWFGPEGYPGIRSDTYEPFPEGADPASWVTVAFWMQLETGLSGTHNLWGTAAFNLGPRPLWLPDGSIRWYPSGLESGTETRLYVDGVLVQTYTGHTTWSDSPVGVLPADDNPHFVAISSYDVWPTGDLRLDLPGVITGRAANYADEVTVFERSLTTAEIRSLYLAGISSPARAAKAVTIVPAVETDEAQALTLVAPIYKTLVAATTTDVAQALTVSQPISVDLVAAVESDASQPVSIAKAATLTSAVESDVAQALTVTKPIFKTLVPATTSDIAEALVVTKPIYKTIIEATETDEAQDLSVTGPIVKTLIAAVESDVAQALIVTKPIYKTIAETVETDQAQPLVVTKPIVKAIAPAIETDLATRLQALRLLFAGETDTAVPLTMAKRVTIVPATTTDSATALAIPQYISILPATESDLATPLEYLDVNNVLLVPAVETDTAVALVATKLVTITPVVEVSEAQALVVVKPLHHSITPAGETGLSAVLSVSKPLRNSILSAVELDEAQPLEVVKPIVKVVEAATEFDEARVLNFIKPIFKSVVPAAEVDEAIALVKPIFRSISPAETVDIGMALDVSKPLHAILISAEEFDEALDVTFTLSVSGTNVPGVGISKITGGHGGSRVRGADQSTRTRNPGNPVVRKR